MTILIVADDLTGACDTGAQLTRQGITTSVRLTEGLEKLPGTGAVAITTDSRADSAERAYEKVLRAVRDLDDPSCSFIYKKVDSTLRGNIGSEMDALFERFQPDFIVLCPAFPANGRTVSGGRLLLHGIPVHETEAGRDLKTPVPTSDIAELIGRQSKHPAASLPLEAVYGDFDAVLAGLKQQDTPYAVVDAESDAELQSLADRLRHSRYRIIWAGSAGLAAFIKDKQQTLITPRPLPSPDAGPVALLVGSVSEVARKQLKQVLGLPQATGIAVHSDLLVNGRASAEKEIARAIRVALLAASDGPVVIYSTAEREDIQAAAAIGAAHGLSSAEIGETIAAGMGVIGAALMAAGRFSKWVLTGGDIARSFCACTGVTELLLTDEVEPGVPVGKMAGAEQCFAVTKAGSFGSETVLIKSVEKLSEG